MQFDLKIYLAFTFPLPDRYFGTAFCSKYLTTNCSIIFDSQSTIFFSLKVFYLHFYLTIDLLQFYYKDNRKSKNETETTVQVRFILHI